MKELQVVKGIGIEVPEGDLSSWTTKDLQQKVIEGHAIVKMGIEAAPIIGRLLIELKSRVNHGEWTKYVEDNLPIKPAMARRYMQYAKTLQNSVLNSDENQTSILKGLDVLSGKAAEREEEDIQRFKKIVSDVTDFFTESMDASKLIKLCDYENKLCAPVISMISDSVEKFIADMQAETVPTVIKHDIEQLDKAFETMETTLNLLTSQKKMELENVERRIQELEDTEKGQKTLKGRVRL